MLTMMFYSITTPHGKYCDNCISFLLDFNVDKGGIENESPEESRKGTYESLKRGGRHAAMPPPFPYLA
jgi:hypothetical protein